MPLVKSVYQKFNSLISQPKHVVGTQKNRLNETVLLSTQNMLKLMGKKILQINAKTFVYLNSCLPSKTWPRSAVGNMSDLQICV